MSFPPAYLDNLFTYHPPIGDQTERYEKMRAAGKTLAQTIATLSPSSPEQTLAIRRVQEAIMWANAAIACNEEEEGEPGCRCAVGESCPVHMQPIAGLHVAVSPEAVDEVLAENLEEKQRLLDSFAVSAVGDKVRVALGDDYVEADPFVVRQWIRQMWKALAECQPTYSIEFESNDVVNVSEWAGLTYLIFPSEIFPNKSSGVWIGHCLEINVVSQSAEGGGPEDALQMTLEAVGITIAMDQREGRDPFERQAPDEEWPEERLKHWKIIRAKLGAHATWKGYDPETMSFTQDAKEQHERPESDT